MSVLDLPDHVDCHRYNLDVFSDRDAFRISPAGEIRIPSSRARTREKTSDPGDNRLSFTAPEVWTVVGSNPSCSHPPSPSPRVSMDKNNPNIPREGPAAQKDVGVVGAAASVLLTSKPQRELRSGYDFL